MAELYAKPYEVIDTGYNPQQTQQGGQDAEMQSYLESLPPEERQKAIERLNAPLTGEELALMAKSGQRKPTLEEFAEIEKFHKSHEVSFLEGLGKIAEGGEQVMTDLSNAFASFLDKPADATSKMPATAVEAFAQGTRNFYGMLAQSQNTDSVLFRVKDFLNGTGTLEDRYNQYIDALEFNKQSADLVEGKQTLVMDKDMINHEVTQAMAYIADPTLFIPFGKVASTGLRAVGLGEKLTMAGARAAAIKNGIIGNTIKWGVGQPLEFMGGAVRNTIDYGLEKAGAAFEATTGISGKEFAQTARMSGVGFSASGIAGYAVPYASTVSDAYLVGSSAKGFGEALTLIGDTMKKNKFGRGINSWAAEALEQAEKNGVALSPHAKGLLKTLNAVDPLFAYGWNGLETAAEGAFIGGTLGYLSDNAEGMYSGIGAGIALGAVGGTAGKVVADITGGTNVARRAVQAKMVIEGHKVTNPEKAMFFQAMQKAAEIRGQDVDLVNGIIAGIDNVAPNFEFHALTPDQFQIEALKRGYNPDTGKFVELSAIDAEFGGDRASRSKAMSILRSIGGEFAGDRKAFLDALKKASSKDSADPTKPASNIPLSFRKYIDVAKSFEKLTKTQQEAILKEIDGQGSLAKELGGNTKLRDHYATLTWAEAWTDQLVKKFESDREGARKDITEMLSQETDKNGKLTRKGLALADKLRAEGFLDRDNKLLRERNLLNADLTYSNFKNSKGAVIERQADGKTHMYINLATMGSETFPHELFHTIMRESPMKKHFTDTLVHKLLGTVDKDGNLVRPAEVNIGQIEKFFKKYIDLTHRNDDGTLNAQEADAKFRQVQDALTEYRNAGENKKISDDARSLLENYTEEFGAYYFSHWLMGRNRNTLFFGGELKGVEGLVERAKDSFKDFWQSKISKSNPEFDFSRGLNEAFDRSKGLGRIGAMDYFMRDMVRAASNANKEVFRPDSMTLDNLRDFERSNGLRNLTAQGGTRRLNPREQVTQNIRLGKEAYKILSGLDKNLRTSKDVLDENGKQIITGRLSEAELDALVKGGIVPRAWADKVNQGYAMLDGTVSNIFSAGYFGRTEQTTDASYPRLTGKDVSFKNRKAVLFDVETKIKADGTFYTLFHTLDLAVIEQRGNHLWQNVDYRNLWNGDRAAFEADFFRYISNASKASTDPKKLDSATLFETGDGNGAKRRDVMHQMAGMALQTGDAYKHQPIAVIPEGIRHSVTTFNIDGMTMPRVETGTRYDINMVNAHKFIRENWQPAEMKQEKTPAGTLFTHETGFKFSAINGKYSAYTNDGSKIGTYGTIREATFAAKNLYNKAQENITKIANDFKQKEEQNRKNLQPLDEATYEEAFRIGDMFKTKRMQEIIGDSKLVRQTFDEFRDQKVEEIISGKNEQEKGAILNQLFSSEFKELIDLEAELKKTYDEFGLEASQLQAQETEITKKIVELGREKIRLQESGNPEAKVDIGILDMYGRIYKRKQEVMNRLSEISNKMHNEGITDLNSHYYITKRFLQNFNETGKLSEEAVKFAITPRLIKAYEANFETGKAVTFLANHGTPNHELMVSKTFNTEFLGRNTGSMSAFNATFFAGSKETSVNYVGNPIEMSWVKNFIDARSFYVKNLPIDVRVKIERALQSDTSKGVVQKTRLFAENLSKEFPEDFKESLTGAGMYRNIPTTTKGEHIYNLVDRILEGANDEGWAIGGYEMYWKEAGRNPYLLRNIVKMDNPYVHEYAKADYRDETFASVIRRAKEAGHDGVIFKNTKDGGGLDTIFASFAKNEDNKIFTLETTEDTRFAPRGTDEAGNKVKGGSEIEGRNYQPTDEAEGGRVYDFNSPKFKSSFIGKYAEENPERLQNKNIEFVKRRDGSYRITMTDNSGATKKIGHITADLYNMRVKGEGIAEISSNIDPKFRGNKLANVLYSEMAERLRAMGVKYVDGTIVNKDGIPVQVRNSVIGQTYYKGSNRPAFREDASKQIQAVQSIYPSKGVGVYNELDFKARYEPAEVDKAPVNWAKEKYGIEGYNYEVVWMTPERFLNLASPLGERAKSEKSRKNIESLKSTLQRNDHDMDMPHLSMNRNKDGELYVVAHEGRHRATAIRELYGDKKIPVLLVMNEAMKIDNDGQNDWDYSGSRAKLKPESERKKGTVSKEFKALEETPFLNEMGTGRYEPTEDEGVIPDIDFDALIKEEKERQNGSYKGKQYTPEQMTFSFIGRYSSKRPEFIKGLDLMYSGSGTTRSLVLSDSKTGERVGAIGFYVQPNAVNKHAFIQISDVKEKFQGRGFGTLLYSELAERLRSEGYTSLDGRVVDELGRPLKIRTSVIDKENISLGENITSTNGERVSSPLYPDAYYQPTEGDDYRGTHKAPSGENGEGSLDAMDRTYPEDLYSAQGARYYGSGQPKLDKQMHDIIMRLRDKPDAMVTVYRAVPKGVDASINKGDWVTPLREYAVLHGNRWEQGMTILEKKVKASELFTEGNSLYEFGWSPKEITKADALRKEIADHEKFMERSRNNAPILWERKGTKIYAQREAMERRLSSLKYELKNIEQESNKPKFQPTEAPLVDAVEMAEARRLGDLFKTKQMREFVGDRKVVPQTADEGFTDFINNFKQADINQQTALYMLDEMAKDMFGGLDRQTLKLKYNELIEKTLPAWFKKYPREKEYFERAKLNRGNDYTFNPEKHEVNLFTRLMSVEDANEFIRMYRELEKPVAEKQRHSGFTRATAEKFAKKIEEAKKWVKKANPQYNDFSGYLAENLPMREYYQHAVYSKKFRTGEPVVAVGVHGTYTSQGFLKDKKYKLDLRKKDLPLSDGELRGAYFAASDATVLSPEYQGYDPKKLGYEISTDFRRRESDSPNIGKSAIRFDNPLVVDGQQTAVMKRTEKILGEAIAAGHDGVIYINQMDGGGLDVSFILPIETVNRQQRMIGSTREKAMAGDAYEPLPRGEGLTNRTANLQPAEYTEFKSEQSPMGRIMRNAKGYVITMANNKFRVYNPAKAIIGVYGSEEEAKKRIYKEIPKQ